MVLNFQGGLKYYFIFLAISLFVCLFVFIEKMLIRKSVLSAVLLFYKNACHCPSLDYENQVSKGSRKSSSKPFIAICSTQWHSNKSGFYFILVYSWHSNPHYIWHYFTLGCMLIDTNKKTSMSVSHWMWHKTWMKNSFTCTCHDRVQMRDENWWWDCFLLESVVLMDMFQKRKCRPTFWKNFSKTL